MSPLHSHFKRVLRYARPSDYALGALTATFAPAIMLYWERVSPSHVGRGGFAPVMRLASAIGVGAGFLFLYQRSTRGCVPASLIPTVLTPPSALLRLDGKRPRSGPR